jgi:hypothetical protein
MLKYLMLMTNNNMIDFSFFVAKLATLNNEKAKLFVDGASALYNVSQSMKLRSLISQYDQMAGYLSTVAQYRGYCTPDEYNLLMSCRRQIEDCNAQLAKHDAMTVVDSVSAMLGLIQKLSKGK